MNYDSYTIEDFAKDSFFRRWVKAPDAETEVFWESWLIRYPEKKEIIEEARELVLLMQFETYVPPPGKYEQIKANIDSAYQQYLHEQRNAAPVRPLHRAVWYAHWQKIAAVLVGILVVFLAQFILVPHLQTVKYRTEYGETRRLVLPDGSTVVLNANSQLSFPKNWEAGEVRTVQLDGEAYFSVVHTRNHQKFIVKTSNKLNVEVLGTEFNVFNRRGQTRVVLSSGKVKVTLQAADSTRQVVMKPGEMTEVKPNATSLSKKPVSIHTYTSWRNEVLTFDDTPLTSIAQLLEDHFGLEVVIPDSSLADRRFTGIASVSNADDLLGRIAKVFDVEVTRNDNKVVIQEKTE